MWLLASQSQTLKDDKGCFARRRLWEREVVLMTPPKVIQLIVLLASSQLQRRNE